MKIYFIGSERQRDIASFIQERKATSVAEITDKFDVTERTIRADLKSLRRVLPIETKQGRYGGGVFWVGLEDEEVVEFR